MPRAHQAGFSRRSLAGIGFFESVRCHGPGLALLTNGDVQQQQQQETISYQEEYKHVSDFDKRRIVAYRDCGLSYRSIAARVGRDPMTVGRILNRWVQDGNTESRTGSQRPPITSS
ncbi:HTH_Tnp_Tc3_2 domain-containing protein [Trichonephila clavipes]|nr:HTH_Tnp_Tc3_2 domain-containing protein [Trichonephila clavipes]